MGSVELEVGGFRGLRGNGEWYVWCMVYGVWCMVYGVWCLVLGIWGVRGRD